MVGLRGLMKAAHGACFLLRFGHHPGVLSVAAGEKISLFSGGEESGTGLRCAGMETTARLRNCPSRSGGTSDPRSHTTGVDQSPAGG